MGVKFRCQRISFQRSAIVEKSVPLQTASEGSHFGMFHYDKNTHFKYNIANIEREWNRWQIFYLHGVIFLQINIQ